MIRGVGRPSESTHAPTGLSSMQADAKVASGKSTPQAQTPVAMMTPVSDSTLDLESFMKAFTQYTQSTIETATIQAQCETLRHDKQQQTSEYNRWSRYFDSYVAIGEDQTRNLKATERAENDSQKQLQQAKRVGEEAMDTIARTILAASTGHRILGSDSDKSRQAEKESTMTQSEELADLQKEVASLKQEFSRFQKCQEREVSNLHSSCNAAREAEGRFDKKISQQAAKITSLINITSDQENLKKDLNNFEAKKIQAEVKSEVEKLGESIDQRLASQQESFQKDIQALQARDSESIRADSKSELAKLGPSISTKITFEIASLKTYCDTMHAKEKESRISESKSEVEPLKKLISDNTSAIARVGEQVSSQNECFKSIVQFRSAVEDNIQKLKRDSASQEQNVVGLQSQQKALDSTIQRLNGHVNVEVSRLREFNDSHQQPQTTSHSIHQRFESFTQEMQQIRNEQQSLKAQFESTEALLEQFRNQLQASPLRRADSYMPSETSEAQPNSMGKRLERTEHNIKSLYAKFDEREKIENDRDREVGADIEELNNLYIELSGDRTKHSASLEHIMASLEGVIAEVKTLSENRHGDEWEQIHQDQSSSSPSLDQLDAEVKTLKEDSRVQADKCAQICITLEPLIADVKKLNDTIQANAETCSASDQLRSDQLRSDQSLNAAALEEIQTKLKTLTEAIASYPEKWRQVEQLQSDMSIFRTQSPPSMEPRESPHINGVKEDEVQPKLEALESKVGHFELQVTDKVKAMEDFLASQESRFNNMTTEPIVMTVIHHLQQLYPLQQIRPTLSRLQQELNSVRQEVTNVKQDITSVKQENTGLKQEVTKATQGVTKVEQEITTFKQEVNAVKQEYVHVIQKQTRAEDHRKQLLRTVNAGRDSDGNRMGELEKSFEEYQDSVKAKAANVDQDSKSKFENFETSIREIKGKLQEVELRLSTEQEVKTTHPKAYMTTLVNDTIVKFEATRKVDMDRASETKDELQNFRTSIDKVSSIVNEVRDRVERLASADEERRTILDRVVSDIEEQRTNLELLKKAKVKATSFDSAQKATHTATEDQTKEISDLTQKVNTQAGNLAKDIETLKHELDEWKSKVALAKNPDAATEDLGRRLGALKEEVKSEAKKQAGEIQSLAQMIDGLDKRIDAQNEKIDQVWDTALQQVADLSVVVDELKGNTTPPHTDNVPAEVGETQKDLIEVLSHSDGDANLVKPMPKRSRDSYSFTGSVERPPRKKKRHPRPNSDDDDEYSDHSRPETPLGTRKSVRNLSQQLQQQTDSPLSRPRRGRPPKKRIE
ncbi:MAG: hypothetical protein Q9166_004866 [cf. Caloplaca sp. 2 TL-2023]